VRSGVYAAAVPKLWNDTIESHRRDVREAILDAAASLVTGQGLASVTMSQIAERAGIGRATLYKYFSDVKAILVAWHERQVTRHLEQLAAIHAQSGPPAHRLELMLGAYARIAHEEHGSEIVALLQRAEHVTQSYKQLTTLLRELMSEGAREGQLREDVPPEELVTFCLHALSASSHLPSQAAVRRLVSVTMAGLRRPKR
jgi:AcrR family transcriptional regulator